MTAKEINKLIEEAYKMVRKHDVAFWDAEDVHQQEKELKCRTFYDGKVEALKEVLSLIEIDQAA